MLRRVRLNLHRRLTISALTDREKRNAVLVRRNRRLSKLEPKIVLIKDLRQPERVIRTRQLQPIKLRTNRSLPNRHRPPPEVELRVLQLRRQHQPKILETLLPVVIHRTAKVLVQAILPRLQQRLDQIKLRIIDPGNAQVTDVVTSHTNTAFLPGLRRVVLTPHSAKVTASKETTVPSSAS